MNNKKYIFFDMDGTLLNSEHIVQPEMINVISTLQKNNVGISIATGRSINMTIKYINQLKIQEPIILSNGNFIYFPLEKKLQVINNPLSYTVKNYFIEFLKRYGGTITFTDSTKDYVYSTDDNSNYIADYSINVIDLSKWSINKLENFLLNINCYHLSAVYIGKTLEQFEFKDLIEHFNILQDLNYCRINDSSSMFIDADSFNAHKYFGIEHVIKKLNLDSNNIYAFGDSNNDLTMIQNIKNSVAMGNAYPNVKKYAKFIIGDNNTNAIADFLKKEFNQYF